MCKRKCTTGDKLHQTHSQEHRPCAMHVLPPRCYYYLGTKPGVMVCQLFPDVCAGTHHHRTGTSERLWGRKSESACGYMCGQEDQGLTTDQQTENNCVWQLNKCKYLCRVFSNALVVGGDDEKLQA